MRFMYAQQYHTLKLELIAKPTRKKKIKVLHIHF